MICVHRGYCLFKLGVVAYRTAIRIFYNVTRFGRPLKIA